MEQRNLLPYLLGGILLLAAFLTLFMPSSLPLPSGPTVTTVTTTTVATTVQTTTTVIGTSTITTTTPITKTWTTTSVVTLPPAATTTTTQPPPTTTPPPTSDKLRHEFVGWYVGGNKVDETRATVNLNDQVELRLKLIAGTSDALGTVTVEIKKDIPYTNPWTSFSDEVHDAQQKPVSLKAGQSTIISATFSADEATTEYGGRVRSYFYKLYSPLLNEPYNPTDPATRECLFVSSTPTTTTPPPTPSTGKLEYVQGVFKFGGVSGAQIRVVSGMEVAVDVKVKAIGQVNGPLKVEVMQDVVTWPDRVHQTLTKDISLKDAEQWIGMGTFLADAPTSSAPFAVREYFIKVYFADQVINVKTSTYDPENPSTREWVKTYDFYCYAVYDSTGAEVGGRDIIGPERGTILAVSSGTARLGEKIWIQTFLKADGNPVANQEVQFIAKYPDGSSNWFWTDGSDSAGFCHKDWTISQDDLAKGSYIDFTIQLIDRYYAPTGLIVSGGGSGAYLGSYTYRQPISSGPATITPTPQQPLQWKFVGWYVGGNKVDDARATVKLGDTVESRIQLTAPSAVSGTVHVDIRKDIVWGSDASFKSESYTLNLAAGESRTIALAFTPDMATVGDSSFAVAGMCRQYFFTLSGLVGYDPGATDVNAPSYRECVFVSR